ncbi:dienelactone hydrolase family protein [Streptomyces cocklensis]|jgi:dienelactone hydrolase|uniref:Hydrolase n=1 Tax=Actinacidiphila cocklensis TaxID=887465 RepID=A0A9W4DZL1_9ACTN|nr:alpha/beta family hydrolase [Actinacidiphila cocklensis]MDD1063339.1 dienelactone hydrolase family protein [Actinacidiphila cocklensis]WSX74900.1 dienelactone hydrolase family protein [Streptomyces sp. NBC_00899]CAG6399051.1 Hydrolase [Actinacidiphila cocklensis]
MISQPVTVPVGDIDLAGDLDLPAAARAVVLFAHGSGSSRHSPRNRAVAAALRTAGLGTLLMDLLTEDEERRDRATGEHRFDIPLLARRVEAAVDWLGATPQTRSLPVVLFGASTGAGAALVAAAGRPDAVLTVVSRGGRPDLAGDALPAVRVPVLLIVGGRDHHVLQLNEDAARRLGGPHTLQVVPGATHLFEERGALEQVAESARQWCDERLAAADG